MVVMILQKDSDFGFVAQFTNYGTIFFSAFMIIGSVAATALTQWLVNII